MEIRISTKYVLVFLQIIVWIFFVGLAVQAGGFITSAVFSIVNPSMVGKLYQQANLSSLFKYDVGHFFVLTFILSLVAILKAILFYLIIRLMMNKKLSIAQPFNKIVRRFIILFSFVSFVIGFFSNYGSRYASWLSSKGITMPDVDSMHIGGADVWIFMAIILLVISQVFKRGIELQTENELTI